MAATGVHRYIRLRGAIRIHDAILTILQDLMVVLENGDELV